LTVARTRVGVGIARVGVDRGVQEDPTVADLHADRVGVLHALAAADTRNLLRDLVVPALTGARIDQIEHVSTNAHLESVAFSPRGDEEGVVDCGWHGTRIAARDAGRISRDASAAR